MSLSLSVSEVVGNKQRYLQFCFMAGDTIYMVFRVFDNETDKELMREVLRGKSVKLWSQRMSRNPFKKKMYYVYYSRGKLFYYRHPQVYKAPLEEEDIDTIADFILG